MIFINILTFSYLFISRHNIVVNNVNKQNYKRMCLENNLNNFKDSNGLKLYSAKDTTTTAIQWL